MKTDCEMKVTTTIPFPELSSLYVKLFNNLYRSKVKAHLLENSLVEFDFSDSPTLLYFFFGYDLGIIQTLHEVETNFKFTEDYYLTRHDFSEDLNSKSFKTQVYAEIAAQQIAHKINVESDVDIKVSDELLDGNVFVLFEFGLIDGTLIFKLAYDHAITQLDLSRSGELWLPFDKYPLPQESGEE